MNLLYALLPLLGVLSIPYNGLTLRGAASHSLQPVTDSVVDFSQLASTGAQTGWTYIVPADTSIVELRGSYWHRYTLVGDTLFHDHTESSRERSDFHVVLDAAGSAPASQYFRAEGRRDMAFVYSDTGHVEITRRFPVTVILAEGDTVTDALLTSSTRSYLRQRVNHRAPSGRVVESELAWSVPGSLTPLAVMTLRTVKVDGHDTVRVGQSTVFPRALNPDANAPVVADTHKSRNASPGASSTFPSSKSRDMITEPTVDYDASSRTVTASGPGGIQLLVCDLQGRVFLHSSSPKGSLTASLSELLPGEYVLSLISGSRRISRTISLGR